MGRDKATIEIGGVPQGVRMVKLLMSCGIPVTVLGRSPIDGADFLADRSEFMGPVSALCQVEPKCELFFLLACDILLFDPLIIRVLEGAIGSRMATVPEFGGRLQPFCALYRSASLTAIAGCHSMMDWVGKLELSIVTEADILQAGLDPRCVLGANTLEELESLI